MDGGESPAGWMVVGGGFRKGPFDTTALARMLRTGRIRAGTQLADGAGKRWTVGEVPELSEEPPWGPEARPFVQRIHIVTVVVMLVLWGCAALLYLDSATAEMDTVRELLADHRGGRTTSAAVELPQDPDAAWTSALFAEDPAERFGGFASIERVSNLILLLAMSGVWLVFVLWLRKAAAACDTQNEPIRRARHELWWVWFVPFWNFYRPLAIVRDIDAASARLAGVRSWTPVLVLWWVLLLAGLIVRKRQSGDPMRPAEARMLEHLEVVEATSWSILLHFASAVLLVAIALRVSRSLGRRS